MATIEDAKAHWQQIKGNFKEEKGVRFAITGDGRGTAASNFFWNVDDRYSWVREHSDPDRPFVILNKGRVNRSYNVPVVLGYDDTEPDREQILGVNYSALAPNTGGCAFGTGSHHDQHEFGGGDEVWVDSRLFIPGLVYPTNPPSMKLNIRPFIYFYKEWTRYAGGKPGTIDLSEFKPRSNYATYVLIALDPDADQIVYRTATHEAATATWDTIIEGSTGLGFDEIPRPSGNEYPLGAVLLDSNTTSIDWTSVDNLFDTRLHIGHSIERLIDRVDQLEGHIGAPPNLATTGAAAQSVDEFKANAWALQGRTIEESEPSDGDPLVWSNTDGVWKPGAADRISWGAAVSSMLLLPGLVGFWPGNAIGNGVTLDRATDLGGNGLHLTRNSGCRAGDRLAADLFGHMWFNGSDGYFSHADDAILDISGTETIIPSAYRGLTLGGWFRFSDTTSQSVMAKWGTSGNRGYMIEVGTSHTFHVSGDGSTNITVSGGTNTTDEWRFLLGRLDPSTELKLWVNDTTYTETSSIPASCNNNNQEFRIGSRSDGVNFLDGRAALCFLCAAAVPDAIVEALFQQTRHLFGV